ncbi:MAG: hypothetical protein QXH26_02045 [Candidatus Hadarchaeales archaeon]
MEVTEETPLSELMENPKALAVLSKHGLPCLFCPAVGFEMGFLKVGQVAKAYGLDVKKLLEDLNRALQEPSPHPQP